MSGELPPGWVEATVGDVGSKSEQAILTGPFGADLGKEDFKDAGVPLLTIGCLTENGIENTKLRFVGEDKAQELDRYRLREGDLLFSRMATVGRTSFVPSGLNGALFNYHLMRLRVDAHAVDPKYLRFHLIGSELTANYLKSVNRGATRDGINTKLLEEAPLYLPPLPEQHRIVERIEALLAKGAKAKAALDTLPALLDRYRQSLLAAAFQESEEGWPEVVVADVAETIFDGPFGSNLKSADYSEAGVRVVRLENIGHLEFHSDKRTYIPQEKYQTLVRHTLKPRDVLFSSFVDEQVRVCLFPDDASPAINKADCFVIRCNTDKCLPEFLAYRLACRSVFKRLEEGIHGATRPRINLGQLKAISFHLPPISQQVKIVRQLEAALSKVRSLNEQIEESDVQLSTLNASILAKAFRGELVPQDPADEPASVLLDRIRVEKRSVKAMNRKALASRNIKQCH